MQVKARVVVLAILAACSADSSGDAGPPIVDAARDAMGVGTVRVLSADEERFEIELTGVRFPAAGDLEVNGIIGAALSPFVCTICN